MNSYLNSELHQPNCYIFSNSFERCNLGNKQIVWADPSSSTEPNECAANILGFIINVITKQPGTDPIEDKTSALLAMLSLHQY